ncbi:RNA polymerase II [Perkinsus chesapeaki]|uniref:protein-serine/threonine phosphatase n=1 Tax=Perkinsus chesapeaki TaxID=330153 RepID=A0A7J6M8G0_PERCH|nr:RNA polymerase II [Perkinsus chesapeaki]
MQVSAVSRDRPLGCTGPSSLERLKSSFVDCALDDLKIPQTISRVCNTVRLEGRHILGGDSEDEEQKVFGEEGLSSWSRPRFESRRTASTDVPSDSEASTGCPSVTGRGSRQQPKTPRQHRFDVILDLDRTLVNSFEIRKADPSESEQVIPILQEVYKDEYGLPELYLCVISDIKVLTKIRPHARAFLRELVSNTDSNVVLSIYTKGTRRYMEEITKMLDPTGELIKGRLVSRDDEPPNMTAVEKDPDFIIDAVEASSPKSRPVSLESLGSSTEGKLRRWFAVLDDSPGVWPEEFREAGNIVEAATYDFAELNYQALLSAVAAQEGLATLRNIKLSRLPKDTDDFLAWEAPEGIWSVRDGLHREYGFWPCSRSSDACSTDDSEPPTPSPIGVAPVVKKGVSFGLKEGFEDESSEEEMKPAEANSRKRRPRRRSITTSHNFMDVVDRDVLERRSRAERAAVAAGRKSGRCYTIGGFPLRFILFVVASILIIAHEFLYPPQLASRPITVSSSTVTAAAPLVEGPTTGPVVAAEYPSSETTEAAPIEMTYSAESTAAAASHLRQGSLTARPAEDIPYYMV